MKLQTILVAATMLVSSLSYAAPKRSMKDICFEGIRALQEPTTEANLTPYDAFTAVDDQVYFDADNIPKLEPTTTGMAVIVLKEIAKVVGTKIYEEIFRDGAKRTLTKADFARIAEIVKEALREDAKRKISNCVISAQETSKELSEAWDMDIAKEMYTTSAAVIDVIVNFDHLYSKVAMWPSAMLLGSLRAGVAQEILIRDASKEDAFFHSGVSRVFRKANQYTKEVETKLLDVESKAVKDIRHSGRRCGNVKRGHAFCIDVVGYFWGKRAFEFKERCEEQIDVCKEKYKSKVLRAEWLHHLAWIDMYNAVYHRKFWAAGTIQIAGMDMWEKELKVLPARAPLPEFEVK